MANGLVPIICGQGAIARDTNSRRQPTIGWAAATQPLTPKRPTARVLVRKMTLPTTRLKQFSESSIFNTGAHCGAKFDDYNFCVRRFSEFLILTALVATACGQRQAPRSDFAAQRQHMVEQQLKARSIKDERVLAAMAKVPREQFIPLDARDVAYEDGPLPIGYDQTISQPYVVAFMTEELRPKPTDRVLEIGSGSGYQAAVLAELVADVYTIEIVEPLAKSAEATLQRLGYNNVHIKVGDGYKGWPEEAPFDAIIVTCAPETVPQPLVDQLKEGGRMVIPVGERFAQQLYLLEKKNGKLKESTTLPVRFVPMQREGRKR